MEIACATIMEVAVPPQKFAQRHPRTTGVIFLLLGLAIAKWQIYDPLHAYENSVFVVWPKLIGVAIIFAVYGAALCILGKVAILSQPFDRNNIDWRVAFAGCLFAAITMAIYFLVTRSLAAHGYTTRLF